MTGINAESTARPPSPPPNQSHHQTYILIQQQNSPVPLRYWDDYPEEIGGQLSSRHRLAMASVVDDFDFFISIEGTWISWV